jgi:UDP-glucose 4-epimerase
MAGADPAPLQRRTLERALVLCGAGFLGTWVTEELTARGIGCAVLGYGARRVGDQAIAITRASVEDMLSAVKPDIVFFLAGSPSVPRSVREPLQDLHDNVGLVLDVLEALRGMDAPPTFVFTSSAAVYGDARADPMHEDHPLSPRSQYGVSKLAAEQYVRLYAEMYGVPGVCVRPFSVYGPGQRKLVIYDLFTRLLAGEDPLVIASPPDVARDFVYIRDVARCIVDLGVRAAGKGEAYNAASGVSTTLAELADHLVATAGVSAEVRFTGELRVGDPLRWRGGVERMHALGVSCPTGLAEGLATTLGWIRDGNR